MARPLVTAKNYSQGHENTEQRAKNSLSQSVSFTEKRKSQIEPRRITNFSIKKIFQMISNSLEINHTVQMINSVYSETINSTIPNSEKTNGRI